MEDSEVGDLWRAVQNSKAIPDAPRFWIDDCEQLIRKLVEERQGRHEWDHHCTDSLHALRDFGIDPATFTRQG